MEITVTKLPKSEVEFTITVSELELTPYITKALQSLAQKVNIEGFRQGKAPLEMVRQRVGDGAILQEMLDEVISKTYGEALEKEQIVTIGEPQIALEQAALNQALIYKAKVAVLPEVTLGDYKSLKIEREAAVVSDEQIDKVITDVRKMRASEASVTRPAQTGDRVIIDFDVFVDNVPIEGGSSKDYPLHIGEGRFIPGFEEQIVGMAIGEVKEFNLPFPAEYHQKTLAGKAADFKVTLKEVFEINLPEFNDEFAKQISNGQVETADALRAQVADNIKQEAHDRAEQQLEIELIEKIVGVSTFAEIPEAMVQSEIRKMIHELEDSITSQGLKFDDYLLHLKKTREELEVDLKPQAEHRVKAALICRSVYHAEKIAVTDDEIAIEVEHLMARYPDNPEVRKQLESDLYRDHLKNVLGNRKVIDYLKSVIIKDKK